MRVFVVLCLGAIVFAENGGYNYQQGQTDSDLPLPIGNDNLDSDASHDDSPYASAAYFEKEYFSFSAPENEFDDPNAAQKIASTVKKGLRVVFIKGPENKALENAALALAQQAADRKTAIYVLNKQTDISDLANKFNAIGKNSNNKPEVHFIKYRTSEDAANAQKTIQSQYDSLGGSSKSHNGGFAPVHNFASESSPRAPTAHTPSNSYLPSSVLRRRYKRSPGRQNSNIFDFIF